MSKKTIIVILAGVLALCGTSEAKKLHVPGQYATIQAAIDDANDGDAIIVETGVYFENIYFGGKNIRLTSTDTNDPTIVATTVINGSQPDDLNFGSVVRFRGTEDSNCILSGFTITGGTGTLGIHEKHSGGGICGTEYPDTPSLIYPRELNYTKATVSNCTVTSNTAEYIGGGIAFCDGTIIKCSITENRTLSAPFGDGGGVAYCNGDIIYCNITGNVTGGSGGGLYNCNGMIQYCKIAENTSHRGSGLASCDGKIHNCTIADNIYIPDGTGMIDFAGGLSDCDGEVVSSLIAGNSSWALSFSHGAVINCTIVGNQKGIFCDGMISNCIIWGNTEEQVSSSRSAVPLYSCVQGGSSGTGCIDADPLFVNTNNGDYRLQPTSPCINMGEYSYCLSLPSTDRDGNCRIANDQVDMGCYEFNSLPDTDGDWLPNKNDVALNNADRDKDGILDGIELLRASDPDVFTPLGIWEVPIDVDRIQEAVFFSRNGENITVLPGIYRENVRVAERSFVLKSVDPNNPDVVSSTIINADTDDDPDTSNGRVVTFDRSENPCKLFGLTLTGGSTPRYGGAVFGGRDPIIIEKCIITGNTAGTGGAIASYRGQLNKCIISRNKAINYDGGGLVYCSGDITDCIITGNYAKRSGGGLYQCHCTIKNCAISYNISNKHGGGAATCRGKFIGCRIIGNKAANQGGGLSYCGSGDGIIGEISSCLVVGNKAAYGGGLANCYTDSPGLSKGVINCTIVGNIADMIGGGVWDRPQWRGYNEFKNCTLWNNTAPVGKEIGLGASAQHLPTVVNVSYCNIEGNLYSVYIENENVTLNWGQNNIDADPWFVEAGYWDANGTPGDANDDFWVEGDYHLLEGSPCIDAGDPNYIPEPNKTDLDGNPRMLNDRIDMGAYEYVPPIEVAMKLTPQSLNCSSKGKWVKAHIIFSEEILPEDIDVNEPAVAEPMGVESQYMKVIGDDEGPVMLEIGFARDVFCEAAAEGGEVEVTVVGWFTSGREFYGMDTIKVKTGSK